MIWVSQRLEDIMGNCLFTILSANGSDDSEGCQQGQTGHCKITTRQDTLPIGALVLLIIFFIALVTLPSGAMSASCEKECCKGSSVKEDTQKCCKTSCTCGTSDRDSDKVQPGQSQRYKDVKCFNACVKSGYRCEHCEDACSYCKE
jgi:hypothetical protein